MWFSSQGSKLQSPYIIYDDTHEADSSTLIPPYLSSNDDNYTSCADTRYDCGKINNIDFPFWGGNRPKHCGHPLLQLNCDRDHDSTTYITIKVAA
ncbi:hypothetical protein Ahy_A04g018642 [Arachis hypogaea]|uniref:Wall-associated receptor kinase galacturonan-binding domain-containing protein n=1 Tax=Arachis hypogaea TaxID=3818 RepID=A0A445DE69_ARAHY|nr:hypothetical protein Ahy_A04g018642 [Arachis hypogaea]